MHHSGRPPVCNSSLCLVAPEISQYGHHIYFQLGQIIGGVFYLSFYLSLVAIGVTFTASDSTGRCSCWSRGPLAVIHDSVICFVIIFSVSTGHVAKYPLLIAWSRVYFVGQ